MHRFLLDQTSQAPGKAEGGAGRRRSLEPQTQFALPIIDNTAARPSDLSTSHANRGAHPDVGATRGDERLRRHGRAMSWPVNWTLPEHRQAMEIRVRGVHWLCLLEMR